MDDQWRSDPPRNDGDFFYHGPLPGGGETVMEIVQIARDPASGERGGFLLIPPGWRGDANRTSPTAYAAVLSQWGGQWAGPEHGLCCVVA